MRTSKQFIVDIAKKPPLVFPFIALAHVAGFAYTLWAAREATFQSLEWAQPLWLGSYTICWIACCDLRRWGAFTYIFITIIDILTNTAFQYVNSHDISLGTILSSCMYPVNILFCFFILFYYKKFK